jgi:ATP-dependent DNA helicase DinG
VSALDEGLKEKIQAAYRHMLNAKDMRPRYGQRLMIAEISRTLANIETDIEGIRMGGKHVCVIEAGTGTGKTIAYFLAAIPVAQALGKKLVVSTATVALQEQIVFKDLPDILKNSGLAFDYTLAKGRSRYVCLSKLDQILREFDAENSIIPLYPDEMPQVSNEAVELYRKLLDGLASHSWDGDRDGWSATIDDVHWQPLTSDRNQCSARKCPHIANCSFYQAREGLDRVDVIVANHDLVLADLALGGGAILTNPEDTIYIFDEGHHLPDKTLSHFTYNARIDVCKRWLEQAEKSLQSLLKDTGESGEIQRQVARISGPLDECKAMMSPMMVLVASMCEKADGNRLRLSHGKVPDALQDMAQDLEGLFERSASGLQEIVKELNEALEDHPDILREAAEAWYPAVGLLQARAENYAALWGEYASDEPEGETPKARWISIVESPAGIDFELSASPILASENLMTNLWDRAFGAVVTSATMTALGRFDRFMMRSGTPQDGVYSVVPSPFNYESALLEVPPMAAEPQDNEAHNALLVDFIQAINPTTLGVLVLFSSWRQMQDVYQSLDSVVRAEVMMQGDYAKHEILRRHREMIDAKQRSIIFGLASFAEGVDLPGDYCSHVVIAKIPFAVPDDPVEAALAEWVESRGGNAFMEISVPDAALKLVQAAGRLLRTESDQGIISILDKRLVTRRYGRSILDSLPPFRRQISR